MDKIKYAVCSFNEGSPYHELWPYVSRCWAEVCGITPVGFLLSDKDSTLTQDGYGYIQSFKILSDFPISLQSQVLRMYGFKFLENEMCIISDADMLPINKKFMESGLPFWAEGKIVSYYRDLTGGGNQITMCYNLGMANDFNKVLGLNKFKTFHSFLDFLSKNYHKEYSKKNSHKHSFGWAIDQMYLHDCWQNNLNSFNFMKLYSQAKFRRLDRENWPDLKDEDIINQRYTDCHFFIDGLNDDRINLLNKLISLAKQ